MFDKYLKYQPIAFVGLIYPYIFAAYTQFLDNLVSILNTEFRCLENNNVVGLCLTKNVVQVSGYVFPFVITSLASMFADGKLFSKRFYGGRRVLALLIYAFVIFNLTLFVILMSGLRVLGPYGGMILD